VEALIPISNGGLDFNQIKLLNVNTYIDTTHLQIRIRSKIHRVHDLNFDGNSVGRFACVMESVRLQLPPRKGGIGCGIAFRGAIGSKATIV